MSTAPLMLVVSWSPALTVGATVAVWAPGSCCSSAGDRNMRAYSEFVPVVTIGAQQASTWSRASSAVSDSASSTWKAAPRRGSAVTNPASSNVRLAASLAWSAGFAGMSAAG